MPRAVTRRVKEDFPPFWTLPFEVWVVNIAHKLWKYTAMIYLNTMNPKIKYSLILLVILIGITLTFGIIRMYFLVKKTKVLIKSAVPYERSLPNSDMKILVLGDSTAYGTGAEKNSLTTAGRLGELFPQADVKTIAENGLKLEGLLEKMEAIDTNEKYAIILIQIGANDIMRLTSMKNIESRIDTAVDKLSKQTDKLIFMHSGNIGDSEFFPFYVKPILTSRSNKTREIYMKTAEKHKAFYVDIISSEITEIMEKNPTEYYADDMLHLNGAGYGLWFDEIRKGL